MDSWFKGLTWSIGRSLISSIVTLSLLLHPHHTASGFPCNATFEHAGRQKGSDYTIMTKLTLETQWLCRNSSQCWAFLTSIGCHWFFNYATSCTCALFWESVHMHSWTQWKSTEVCTRCAEEGIMVNTYTLLHLHMYIVNKLWCWRFRALNISLFYFYFIRALYHEISAAIETCPNQQVIEFCIFVYQWFLYRQ